jgi:hypothetical protein
VPSAEPFWPGDSVAEPLRAAVDALGVVAGGRNLEIEPEIISLVNPNEKNDLGGGGGRLRMPFGGVVGGIGRGGVYAVGDAEVDASEDIYPSVS